MRLIQQLDSATLNDFLAANPGISGAEFLLSSAWQAILRREGAEVMNLAIMRDLDYGQKGPDAANLLAVIILVKKSLGSRFFYWYAPRGPLLKNDLNQEEAAKALRLLFSGVRRLSRRALFLKTEPASGNPGFWRQVFPRMTLAGIFRVRKTDPIQPRRTLMLNLALSDAELLAQMHQKTRYNIRLAEKKDVRIISGRPEDFTEFWRLMNQTGERDGFRLHRVSHYKNLIADTASGHLRLFFAEYEGRKVATALLGIFGRKAVYLHGGSDHGFRQAMAPYFLQWEMMRQARALGARIYDFYGIDEDKWPGVTRFKRGFGGEEKEYPGAFDIIFRPALYCCYRLAKLSRLAFKKYFLN